MASKNHSSSSKSAEITARRNTAVPPTIQKSTNPASPASASAAAVQPAIASATASIAGVLDAGIGRAKEQAAATAAPATVAKPAVVPATPASNPRAEQLIGQLRDFTAEVARDAATELGQLADRKAVEPLIAVLANVDGYYHLVVRAAAAGSLGLLRDHRAVSVLVSALRDSMAEISAEAALALGHIGTPEAIQSLRPVIENHDGYFLPMSRRAAIKAVSHSLNADLRDLLKRIAGNESEDASVRQAATAAIA